MTMLVKAFGQKEPTFAVGMVTSGAGARYGSGTKSLWSAGVIGDDDW
jgi:membrane-bound inhibitor of C-type lysozyme